MLKINDYECPACGVFEGWGSTEERLQCPTCGAKARPVIGTPGIILSGRDPGFPRAWRRWADAHEKAGDGPYSVRKDGER